MLLPGHVSPVEPQLRTPPPHHHHWVSCSKIAEAEAAVSVNEKKWLVMHAHVQLRLDELRGPPTLGSL
jgi:hypothetical protein